MPLHPEFRTMPMLFYVPPLLPVMGTMQDEIYSRATGEGLFSALDQLRLPMRYLAALFAAGNVSVVESSLRKMMAVRWYRRSRPVGDVDEATVQRVLGEAGLTPADAEAIYRISALATIEDRYALPPLQREQAVAGETAEQCRESSGFGQLTPRRGR